MGSASVPGAYSSLRHAHAYRPDQRALRSHWCVTTSRSHAKGPCRNDAKMSSALAKSSGAIWYSAAAAFSATCSGRVAPIIAEDTSCLRNTQASATRSPSRGTARPHQPITPERLGHPKANSPPWKATNFRRATETHRSSRVSARVAITVTISWGVVSLRKSTVRSSSMRVAAWNGARRVSQTRLVLQKQ